MVDGRDVSSTALCDDDIYKAINTIRYKNKKRPDRVSIFKILERKNVISEAEFNKLFEELLQNKLIVSKQASQGNESYFINEVNFDKELEEILVDPVVVTDTALEEAENLQSVAQPSHNDETLMKSQPDAVDAEMRSLEETYSHFKTRMDIAEKSYLSLLLESYRDTIKHLREEIIHKNNLIHHLLHKPD